MFSACQLTRRSLKASEFTRNLHSPAFLGVSSITRRNALRTTNVSVPSRSFQHKSLDDVRAEGNVKVASTGTWESRRYFLAKDGVGFSFHNTVLYKGSTTLIWYKNHYEAVFITKGTGQIEVVTPKQERGQGKVYKLKPGDAYLLDKHDRHFLSASADSDLEVVCAFSPALRGDEDHDEDGAYV